MIVYMFIHPCLKLYEIIGRALLPQRRGETAETGSDLNYSIKSDLTVSIMWRQQNVLCVGHFAKMNNNPIRHSPHVALLG